MLRQFLIAGAAAAAFAAPAAAEGVIGVTSSSELVYFSTVSPDVTARIALSGIGAGESIVGIDYRPATNQLYALTNNAGAGRVYTVDIDFRDLFSNATATATAVGAPGAITLDGQYFGIDFNPSVDRLRVVSNTGQNIRINQLNGTIAAAPPPDQPLNFSTGGGSPSVVAAAYTPAALGAPTTLYVIDERTNGLYTQGNPPAVSPNSGTLFFVGTINSDGTVNTPDEFTGFDISNRTGRAFVDYDRFGQQQFFVLNTQNAFANPLGSIGTGFNDILDFAVVPFDVPAPGALALFGLGLAGLAAARRR